MLVLMHYYLGLFTKAKKRDGYKYLVVQHDMHATRH